MLHAFDARSASHAGAENRWRGSVGHHFQVLCAQVLRRFLVGVLIGILLKILPRILVVAWRPCVGCELRPAYNPTDHPSYTPS